MPSWQVTAALQVSGYFLGHVLSGVSRPDEVTAGGHGGCVRGVAVVTGGGQPEPMNPLMALILGRMRERGWSNQDVVARGVTWPTLHRYTHPVRMRQPPRPAILQALANALDLPLSQVQKAAVDSVGYLYQDDDGSTIINVAALERLPTAERRAEVERLRRILDEYL